MEKKIEEINKEKKGKKKKKISKWTIACTILDILVVIFFLVVYGPFHSFKNWWITTALASGHHKYFANVLYSKADIQRALENNKVLETDENTNIADITFNDTRTDHYESIYEEQVLKRDEGNDLYKVVEIDEKDYKGFLVVVYDASRISLATSSRINYGGQKLVDMAKDKGAIVAINASGFGRRSGGSLLPTGTVIQNGKISSVGGRNRHGGGLIGFTKNNVLMLTTESATAAIKKGLYNAMTFGPFLIVNGEPAQVKGNGGWGVANRTAIAQRKDGIVLFLVIDGRSASSSGISIADMITLLEKYGAYNAANLDGGGSSTLVVKGELINSPRGYGYSGQRYLPNAWIVK